MTVSYDGSKYHGYQKQPDMNSVQETLENILTSINSNDFVSISASGRTDSGVHALNQKIHFDLDKELNVEKLKYSINRMLPPSIYVKDLIIASDTFHARFDVKRKEYTYKINLGEYNPIECDYVYQYNSTLDIDKMKDLNDFVRKELKSDIDLKKIDSDLVKLINILSRENLDETLYPVTALPFEIQEKIDFNGLGAIKTIIKENALFSKKLNDKYEEFDRLGVNKSHAILNVMRSTYQKLVVQHEDTTELFYKIIETIVDRIKSEMSEDNSLSQEELELYVQIIVVDAFMKCKIFKNPEEYKYVAS